MWCQAKCPGLFPKPYRSPLIVWEKTGGDVLEVGLKVDLMHKRRYRSRHLLMEEDP